MNFFSLTISFRFCSLLPPSHPAWLLPPLPYRFPFPHSSPFVLFCCPLILTRAICVAMSEALSNWSLEEAAFADCLYPSTDQLPGAQEGAVGPPESLFHGFDDRPSLCWSSPVRSHLLWLCHDWRTTFSVSFPQFLALHCGISWALEGVA